VNENGAGARDVQGDLLIVIERKCVRSCPEFNIGQRSAGRYDRLPHYEAVAKNGGASYAARAAVQSKATARLQQGYSKATACPPPGHNNEYQITLFVTKRLIATA